MTEVPIPRDTTIFANLRQCNIDPALWGEDADEWKPERWAKLKEHERSETEPKLPGVFMNTYVP